MGIVTVLGAGAMGSAFCTPLSDAGWQVRLWGTIHDDALLDACAAGYPHPRTTAPLPRGVEVYRHDELTEALDGAEVVAISVASTHIIEVAEPALEGLSKARVILMTSKGLLETVDGKVVSLTEALRQLGRRHGFELPPIVGAAGPGIAGEVAHRRPTAAVFGCAAPGVALEMARTCCTDAYRVEPTTDEIGVEMCAPLKNVYAIALGISDGLEESTGAAHANLKAATFAQAVREMATIVKVMGGDPLTAYGLAGTGDLEVTGAAGRNKLFGMRLGLGQSVDLALSEMTRLGQTVEGLPATHLAAALVDDLDTPELPLLNACVRIARGEVTDVRAELAAAALPVTPELPPAVAVAEDEVEYEEYSRSSSFLGRLWDRLRSGRN